MDGMEKQLVPTVTRLSVLRALRNSSLQSRCVCAGVTLLVVVMVLMAVGIGLNHRKLGNIDENLQSLSSITRNLNEEINYMARHSCAKMNLSTPNQIALIPTKGGSVPVVCDTKTDGGNWIIIQRRRNGDPSFPSDHLLYSSYALDNEYLTHGVGTAFTDYWLAISKIRKLCNEKIKCELRIDMKLKDSPYDTSIRPRSDHKYYAYYKEFYLTHPGSDIIKVSGYKGTAGDALSELNGIGFEAYVPYRGCKAKGAWWTRWNGPCDISNLNGKWNGTNGEGVIWKPLTGPDRSLYFTEMKIRQKK